MSNEHANRNTISAGRLVNIASLGWSACGLPINYIHSPLHLAFIDELLVYVGATTVTIEGGNCITALQGNPA